MLVMKFGGTSVADAERLRRVADLVAERQARAPVVVVSALGGVTDELLAAVGGALAGPASGVEPWKPIVSGLLERHLAVLAGLELPSALGAAVEGRIRADFQELDRLCYGIATLGEATARSRDAVLGRGERISSELLAARLQATGRPAVWVDARELFLTDATFGQARPDRAALARSCEERLRPLVAEGRIPVMAGFVGATAAGLPTTLGRGGSDLSASLLGAALGAAEVQIWTDVDGMMTADPRIAPRARVLPHVPYDEAAELACFGAKVLHPATIRPAVEAGIPVRIKNSLRPEAPGTEITAPTDESGRLTAVARKKGITVLTIASPRMLMAHGVLARIFAVFDQQRTSVDLVATSEVSVSLTVDDASRLEAIAAELSESFRVETRPGCAIVALVGRGILRTPGIAGRVFAAVRDFNVRMISVGASDVNVSFVVAEDDADAVVAAVHAEFFEEEGMSERLKVLLSGRGRMGLAVAEVLAERGHELAGFVARTPGSDFPGLAQALREKPADVVIDFTGPAALESVVEACLAAGRPLVTGTTGWTDRWESVRARVEDAGGTLLFAPNFSLGVQLFLRAASQAARLYGRAGGFDVMVEERHHRQKVDAPSGTGLELARRVLDASPEKERIRWEPLAGRPAASDLQVTAARCGSEAGTHALLIDGPDDFLVLRHSARGRRGFAAGAVRAAEWLIGRRGVFTMDDLIDDLLSETTAPES